MIVEGRFKARKNRFAAIVDIYGKERTVYLPNSGRMKELLVPEARVLLSRAGSPTRKTDFDLIKVNYQNKWVSIDSREPNKLFASAVTKNYLEAFRDYELVREEVTWGKSRLDILLNKRDSKEELFYIELKSVTLVKNGVAMFPDAPTTRGRKHLETLTKIVESGSRAGVVFIVQRSDAHSFSPNDRTDPEFAESLRKASRAGVDIFAYICDVDEESIEIKNQIDILL